MKPLLVMLMLLVTGLAQAEVYKSVNEKGEVVYSDTPVQGAERMRLPELQTYTPPPVPKFRTADKPAAKTGIYDSFDFLKPGNESTIRNNLGIVELQLRLEPSLKLRSNHRIQFYMNGERYGPLLDRSAITISNVDRGTHTFSASVFDAGGAEQISTPTITVYVQRESQLISDDRLVETPPGSPGVITPLPGVRTKNPNIRTDNPNIRSPNPNVISPPAVPTPLPRSR